METTLIINTIIDNLTQLVFIFVLSLITIGLQYLKNLAAKKLELSTVADALDQLDIAIADGVMANKQVYADAWKAAAADGKLTEDEIAVLHKTLISNVYQSVTPAIVDTIAAAGIDIEAYILRGGEAVIGKMKTAA